MTVYLDLTIDANTFPEKYNEQIKNLYKRKFEALSLSHKILIKEMIDHRLAKNNHESLRLIDDVFKLEQNPSEAVDDKRNSMNSNLDSNQRNQMQGGQDSGNNILKSSLQMLRENLKVVKLHNMLQLQMLVEKMKQEHETKLIEEPLNEQYMKDYEFCQAKVREMKQKRKENKFEEDEDYPEDNRKTFSEKRKKNPPRRNRNTRKKRGSIGLSDYNLEESYDDSDKWNI